ncbi:TPM domain-containing protein [Yoonia sp. 208BN28-4]|uniref:TPM domain-containing protein n=1 Tax=Yoonia sp. 208BN28-4 TaxID=3126505 RepID=UPI0030A7D8E3
MRISACILAAAFVGFAVQASAQIFPEPASQTVNDFADMLSDEAEARITETLSDLETDTGAQATIVTLSSVQFYANDMTVPDYATALFNEWGIGNADDGDGVLLLVFRDDRQLRLETGAAYDADAQDRAQSIISEVIIPEFQNDNFEAGIEAGATAIAERLVRNTTVTDPALSGDDQTDGEGGGNVLWYILGGIGAVIAAAVAWGRMQAAKLAATPCPACGKTELSKERVVLQDATLEAQGHGEVRTICGACGHTTAEPFTLSKKTPPKSDDPDFDGGKSDGGGASGKW